MAEPTQTNSPVAGQKPVEGRTGLALNDSLGGLARPALISNPPRRTAAAIASVSQTAARSILLRETECGKPLGQCTKFDLVEMARTNRKRAWFYDALQAPMPAAGHVAAFYDDDAVRAIEGRWNEGAQA